MNPSKDFIYLEVNTYLEVSTYLEVNTSSDYRNPDKWQTWSWVRLPTVSALDNRCIDSFCNVYIQNCR
jgi:hypothetical protein